MRIFKVFLTALCFLLLFAVTAFAFGEIQYPDRPLNLRQSRSAKAKWVGSLYPGQKVRVAFMEDGWVAIFEPGETRASENAAVGFSNAKYLKPKRTRHEPKSWGEMAQASRTLNIRSAPSFGGKVVDQLEPGERVRMDFPDGDWTMVFAPEATIRSKMNARGFSSAKYLEPANEKTVVQTTEPVKEVEPVSVADQPAESGQWGKVLTIGRKVNLREGRTTGSSYVRTLQPGETVRVAFLRSGWYAVFDPKETRQDEKRAQGYALQSLVESGARVETAESMAEPEQVSQPQETATARPEPQTTPKPPTAILKQESGQQQTVVIDRSKFVKAKRPDPTPNQTAHGYQYRILENSETKKFGETWVTLKVFLATTKLPGTEAIEDFSNTLWNEHRHAGKKMVVLLYLPGMDTDDLSYGVVKFNDEKMIELWLRKAALLGTKFL